MVVAMIFDQFLLATAVLTRLPVAPRAEESAATEANAVAAASWAFPAVGAGIGMIAALALFLATSLGVGETPAVLLALVAAGLLTGAMHEDGLADTVDGLGGGRDREEKLAIMHDAQQGTYGILALVFSIGLRAAALVAIGSPIEAGLALIAAHAASRAVLAPAMLWLRPARADGLGATAGRPGEITTLVSVAIGVFIALGMLGPVRGAVGLVLMGVVVTATAMLAHRQIGGYTGDILGALQQIGEITMLLVAAAR